MHPTETPLPSDIRDQLDKLRHSHAFTGSERLLTFLSYLVEEALNGRGSDLREATIGNAVYRREPPYDPRIDSTVRVEARRLRRKLADYFAAAGRDDPVRITIPTGGYLPQFSLYGRDERGAEPGTATLDTDIFEAGRGAAVAILPFRALSQSGTVRDFADGLTDELIYALGTEPGLRVPSRSVVFPFVERQQSTSSVALELGVDAVLQGTVRERDDMMRITIEVSDRKGFVVSSDRFDGYAKDRLRLQEKVAATLVSRLRLDSSAMRARLIGPRPPALEAHSRIYRARRLVDTQTPAALREALAIFEDVASAAPDYARGYSGIADCCCDLYRLAVIDRATALKRATTAAQTALSIDPRSAEAHSAHATIEAWLKRDGEKATESFETALDVDRSARAARIYGTYLAFTGFDREADRSLAEAREIEPFSQQQDIAESISRYQSRRYERLVDGNLAFDRSHAPGEAVFYIALARYFSGDSDGARDLIPDLSQSGPGQTLLEFAHAEVAAWLGSPDEARHLLSHDRTKASPYTLATLAAAVGDHDAALSHLERSVAREEFSTVWMRSEPRFDVLRGVPAFERLAAHRR